jgi:hypothetical protein
MVRNTGSRSLAPDQVLEVMSAAVDMLCGRLPGTPRKTVEQVVYDVTAELVSTITDAARLATMLRLRATARLCASSGQLTPIRSSAPAPADPTR